MDTATGDTTGEDAYESYLDAALRGEAPEPDVFFARHPEVGAVERTRIEALHRLARDAPRRFAAAPAETVPEPDLPWERLGEFRLLRRLGSGGMGQVFEAEQPDLGRNVALKVVRPHLRVSREAVERFRREARTAARLRHRNIVAVHAAGEDDGVLWLVMDLAPGSGLDEILAAAHDAGTPVPPARIVRWGARLARALEYAHERGIVHRDLKPSNIRIGPDDQPLLLDFGIARDEGAESTLTGPMVGSPHYAAPEQILGEATDGRTDVYGLGATLYECLGGAPPFAEGSVDRIVQQALTTDPRPLRLLRPGIHRDLEAVVLKALEKEPARRYANARAMAEDLEAVLDFRPVQARPAGAMRRLRAWARARPGPASAALTGIVAVLALAAVFVNGAREEILRVRREAAGEVDLARHRLDEFRRGRVDAEKAEQTVARLRVNLETLYVPESEDRELDRIEDRVLALRRGREQSFHAVLEHLRRAETLDADVEGTEEVRAEAYLERWRDAHAAGDKASEEFYRALAVSHDSGGEVTAGSLGNGTVSFTTDPPGAEVHLFRFVEQTDLDPGGEPRLVPVPFRGASVVAPGQVALRVVRGAGDLAQGDLLVEVAGFPVGGTLLVTGGDGSVPRLARLASIDGSPARGVWSLEEGSAPGSDANGLQRAFRFDFEGRTIEERATGLDALGIRVARSLDVAEAGGVRARAWTGGALVDIDLPTGLQLRETAIPLPVGRDTLLGRTPVAGVQLELGSYLAVCRREGYAEQRIHLTVLSGRDSPFKVELVPEEKAPPGFVRVPFAWLEHGPAFWIGEREVTCAEYLEFLNDPATLRIIDGSNAPVLYPRGRPDQPAGHWPRNEDGTYRLAEEFRPDWPVLGVSWDDASAYAAWRTRREREAGGKAEYRLPTHAQWIAAGGIADRVFVYGNRFRAKWQKSCFARPRAMPEPGMRFPRDESPFGAFDMGGSVCEWLDDWYDEARGLRRLGGGCWAYAAAESFGLYGNLGWHPDRAGDDAGFRLVRMEGGE